MTLIEPKFEIDKKNRVLCQSHSNYFYFISLEKDFFEDMALEGELTCLTCSHYKKNECFFPQKKIDNIESERLKSNKHACKLCGNKIHRMFTIIQKLYFEEEFLIEMPLICCNCFDDLSKDEFVSTAKRSIYTSIYVVISILFLLYLIPLFFIGNVLIGALYLVILIPFSIIVLKKYNLRIKRGIIGIKYYKKNFMEKQHEDEVD